MIERINSFPDFSGSFGDKRISKRADQALNSLTQGRNSSLRQVSKKDSEQKSFYRLFNNESFTETGIQESIVNRCGQICKGRHVLCIQDTTEFNLSKQRGRIAADSGLGRTSKDDVLGFMLHSSLVIDADKSTALGYSFIKVWHREEDSPDRHERKYQQQSIENKESYKWIEATRQSSTLLKEAALITIIADRESDIYDLIAEEYDSKIQLLLRCNFNRRLASGVFIKEHLNNLEVMHEYTLEVRGDVRKNIEKRTAKMELKWDKVTLTKPKNCHGDTLPKTKELYIVEAKEKKTNGIVWRIYVTHPVTTAQEALQVIEWYKQRWYIEQVHRLLKTDGFRIERSQLEQGWAIRKLTLLAMMATLRILQMMLAYEDDKEEQLMEEVFTQKQQQCLQMINVQMEGQTVILKNTADPKTLRWATWVIARLGGWKGYRSQRKPGPIVLQRGLAKFYLMFEGWTLFDNLQKNVSTQ